IGETEGWRPGVLIAAVLYGASLLLHLIMRRMDPHDSQWPPEPTWRHLCLARSVAPLLAWTLGQEALQSREDQK
ncbi:hypothetical protein MTO96_038123, partial [Rhipicephalus appendiculatus]